MANNNNTIKEVKIGSSEIAFILSVAFLIKIEGIQIFLMKIDNCTNIIFEDKEIPLNNP